MSPVELYPRKPRRVSQPLHVDTGILIFSALGLLLAAIAAAFGGLEIAAPMF